MDLQIQPIKLQNEEGYFHQASNSYRLTILNYDHKVFQNIQTKLTEMSINLY